MKPKKYTFIHSPADKYEYFLINRKTKPDLFAVYFLQIEINVISFAAPSM